MSSRWGISRGMRMRMRMGRGMSDKWGKGNLNFR